MQTSSFLIAAIIACALFHARSAPQFVALSVNQVSRTFQHVDVNVLDASSGKLQSLGVINSTVNVFQTRSAAATNAGNGQIFLALNYLTSSSIFSQFFSIPVKSPKATRTHRAGVSILSLNYDAESQRFVGFGNSYPSNNLASIYAIDANTFDVVTVAKTAQPVVAGEPTGAYHVADGVYYIAAMVNPFSVKQHIVGYSARTGALVSNVSVSNAYITNLFYDDKQQALVAYVISQSKMFSVAQVDGTTGTVSNIKEGSYSRADYSSFGASFSSATRQVTVNFGGRIVVNVNVDTGGETVLIAPSKMPPAQNLLQSFSYSG